MTDTNQTSPIKEIKVIRSPNRRRTVSARLSDGILVVNAPARIPDKELEKLIAHFKERLLKKKLKRELNQKQDL